MCWQFIIGWNFHIGAYRALKRGTANMDVLVSLGTNAAYIYSVISIFHERSLYQRGIPESEMDFFETSALLITFISCGKLLEVAAKGKTSAVGILCVPTCTSGTALTHVMLCGQGLCKLLVPAAFCLQLFQSCNGLSSDMPCSLKDTSCMVGILYTSVSNATVIRLPRITP